MNDPEDEEEEGTDLYSAGIGAATTVLFLLLLLLCFLAWMNR